MSSGVSSKSNTLKEETIMFTSPSGSQHPLGTGGLSSWLETRGDREVVSVLSFQENNLGPLLSSHLSFPHLLLLCPPH